MPSFSSTEQLKIPSPPAAEGEDNDCRLSSFSNLSRWKSLTLSEVQSSQFGGIAIFNLQERANRYFLATFSQGTGELIVTAANHLLSPSLPLSLPPSLSSLALHHMRFNRVPQGQTGICNTRGIIRETKRALRYAT